MPKQNNNSLMKTLLSSALILFFVIEITFVFANDKIIATVNGKAITEKILNVEVNKRIPLASFHSNVSKEKLNEVRQQTLQKLIEEELLFQEAKKRKLAVGLFEIEQRIALMKKGFKSEKDFQKAMANSGLNALSLMEHIERSLLIKKIYQLEIQDKVTVTDADIKAYFEANQSKFVIPEQFRTRHILVSVAPGAMGPGWQAGLNEAEQLYSRIVAGEDFAQIAKKFSADSTSRDAGGDIGWFHKGQLIPELEEALNKLQLGEVSKPVRSIYGFHIIKLEEKKPQKQLKFDEINIEELKVKLFTKRIESRRKEYLERLKAQAKIQIRDF